MLLQIGCTGETIKAWQKFVGVSMTGVFDPETERATKFFQMKSDLREDGMVGSNTLEAARLHGFVVPTAR